MTSADVERQLTVEAGMTSADVERQLTIEGIISAEELQAGLIGLGHTGEA